MNSTSRLRNSPCEEIQQTPVVNHTDEGPVDNTYRVLPLFEVEAWKAQGIQTYSLKNNERLAKEWGNRVRKLNEDEPASEKHPKKIPDISDYHFKNCRTQLVPSMSQRNFHRPHLLLKPGPGPDKYGERPIPVELMMRRCQTVNQNKAKLKNAKNKMNVFAESSINK